MLQHQASHQASHCEPDLDAADQQGTVQRSLTSELLDWALELTSRVTQKFWAPAVLSCLLLMELLSQRLEVC